MNQNQHYEVGHKTVYQLLSNFQQGDILIPEIQRPFVWKASQVRDLIDSLYKGYPIGYIVTSKSPNVQLKNGKRSGGETMLIDGQQRVTALAAALLGVTVTDADYNKKRIQIDFSPITKEFAVSDASTRKDKTFINDISCLFGASPKISKIRREYCAVNPDVDEDDIGDVLDSLVSINNREVGILELSRELDMDAVTDIFKRINQMGVQLKEADFVMSKIAANDSFCGGLLRKTIDHFCELVVKPDRYETIAENDKEFAASQYLSKVSWLRKENDDIYDPSYEDLLRVVLTYKFKRGKMGDLVQLLVGRNFTTRSYEQEVIEDTYDKLTSGMNDFISEYNFKNFVMIISSAGFCRGKLVRSMGAMNFAYALYLHLRSVGVKPELIQHIVRRWFVMAQLTGRYSSSAETRYESDIKQITERGAEACLSEVERLELSEVFWNDKLINNLWTSGTTSPAFNVYLAAQCKNNVRGFLSTDITVRNMIEERGDVHHIFPKQFLKDNGLSMVQYNQVANYAFVQTEINIKIGKREPNDYFAYVVNEQCNGAQTVYGGITDLEKLRENMTENCIPIGLEAMTVGDYQNFLAERRKLMAYAIKEYYYIL